MNHLALPQVHKIVEKELAPYLSHISAQQMPKMSWLDRNFWAALVLIPAGNSPAGISCGGVVQLVYYAQQIHNMVPEKGEAAVYRYPILLGDYLFAKAFRLLLASGFSQWLSILATVTENANEARVAKLQKAGLSPGEIMALVEQEYGNLAALAAKMGASVGDCSPGEVEALAEAAYAVGVLHGMIKEEVLDALEETKSKAESAVQKLPDRLRDVMNELYQKVLEVCPVSETFDIKELVSNDG